MVVLRLVGVFLFLFISQQSSAFASIYLSINAPNANEVHAQLRQVAVMYWGKEDRAERNRILSSGTYRLAVNYSQDSGEPAIFTITRLKTEIGFEPMKTSWVLRGPDASKSARKLLNRYLRDNAHLNEIAENILMLGATASAEITPTDEGFTRNDTGENLDFHAAAELFQTEKPKHRHWMRMMFEMAMLFGAQEFFYWGLTKSENEVDFDYSFGKRWFIDRFITRDAWSLDDNLYNTNAWRHPAQGALNYVFARSNNFNSLESYLMSFALSSIWEFLGEHREKVSINDLIVTPAAGSAIGEAFMQLGAFFFRSENSKINKILGNIFGSPRGLHDWLDKSKPKHSTRLSNLGFDETIWHEFQFELAAGVKTSNDGNGLFSRFSLDSQILMIPGIADPGERSGVLFNGNFSQISIRADVGADGAEDFLFYTKAAIATYFKKKIAISDEDKARQEREGYYFLLGLSTAYEYGMHASDSHRGFLSDDRIAIAHVLGGSMYLTVYTKGWEIRAVVDLFGDFAMLRNFAYEKASDQLPAEAIVKSSIARENYYYALGFTFDSEVTAKYKNFEAGGKVKYGDFDSIDKWDRHQGELTHDFDLDDSRSQASGWIGYKMRVVKDFDVKIRLTIEQLKRAGSVLMTQETLNERRVMFGAFLVF